MNKDFFTTNRKRLQSVIGDDILILTAYDKMQQTNDAAAFFKQESNFWWLTGIDMPGWKFIYDGRSNDAFLVRPQLSRVEQVFESWYDDATAIKISGIKTIISETEYSEKVADFAQAKRSIKTIDAPKYKDIFCQPNPSLARLLRELKKQGLLVESANLMLSKLRAIKSPEEIKALREAIRITNEAFEIVKRKLPHLTNERDIEAEFNYQFTKQGARHAYDPIVAFGSNACTLHYVKNNAPLTNGLVLLDIGASLNGYNADITRTYAVHEVTSFEHQLHLAVVQTQTDIIALIKPGLLVKDYMHAVDERMKQALIDLKLINTADDDRYRQYFPHAISHGLGVDVHDSLGRAEVFKEGMVLTVEPGIYVPEKQTGVRIEDDILVTANGNDNLSASLATNL